MSVNFWNFELSGTSAVDFWETGTSIDGTIPGLSRMTPEQLKKKLDIESGTSTSAYNIDYNEVNLMITSAVNNSVVSAMSGISTEVNNYIDASIDNVPSIVSAAVSALPKNYKEYVDYNENMTFPELEKLAYEGKGIKYTYEDNGIVELIDLYIMPGNRWGDVCPILLKENNLPNNIAPLYIVAVPDYDDSDEEPPLIKFITEIEDISSLSYNFSNNFYQEFYQEYDYGHWCDSSENALASNWKDILNFIDYCSYQNIDAYLKIYMGGLESYPYIAHYPRLKLTKSSYNSGYSINGYGEDDNSLYKLFISYNECQDLRTSPRVTSIYAYSIKKDIYFDFWNDIDDNNHFYLNKISNMVNQLININGNSEYSIDNDDDKILDFFDILFEYQDNITGGTGYSKNYKFIELDSMYDSDYDDYLPYIVFVDERDSTYHMLRTRYDINAEPGNHLYIEYITRTASNDSNGPLYENYIFDDEANPDTYVWNENGVITNIELIDYAYDNDETYPCSVSALYIGHGSNLDSELDNNNNLERKSDSYMPANLSKILIHNNSTGYNPELNSGINVYYCGSSEEDIILSGVAEWGKSYVMDFVGPYVEWRYAPNMVKIPEPNFDNDKEGIK